MTNDRIRIVASDGDEAKTVGAVNRSQHCVFTFVSKGSESFHATYHSNGLLHHKIRPRSDHTRTIDFYCGPPLNDFSGFVWTGFTSAVNDSIFPKVQAPSFSSDDRPYDSITYIDIQRGKYGRNYTGFICRPGFPVGRIIQEALSQATSVQDSNPRLSYQVYTETDPWIGIVHWDEGTHIPLTGATHQFRPMGYSVDTRARENPYPKSCPNGERGCDGPDGSGPICRGCYEKSDNEY